MDLKALDKKIKELQKTTPDLVMGEVTPKTREWLFDIYAIAKELGLLNEPDDLSKAIDTLTSYLENKDLLKQFRESAAITVENSLSQSASIIKVKILALGKVSGGRTTGMY